VLQYKATRHLQSKHYVLIQHDATAGYTSPSLQKVPLNNSTKVINATEQHDVNT